MNVRDDRSANCASLHINRHSSWDIIAYASWNIKSQYWINTKSSMSSKIQRFVLRSLLEMRAPMQVVNASRLPRSTHTSGSKFSSLAIKNRQRYQLPNVPLDQKIRFVKSLVPVGAMDQTLIKFSCQTIHRLAQKKTVQSLQEAEELLDRLVRERESNNTFQLTSHQYIAIIQGWSEVKSENALSKAKELLDTMKALHEQNPQTQPQPDLQTFSAFLFCCTKSHSPDALDMADQLVRDLEDRNFPLTTQIYNNVILAHANQAATRYGAATTAEDWLLHLSKKGTEGGPQPNIKSFNRVLKAWCISAEGNGAKRASEILQLLIKMGTEHDLVHPDSISFSTVITAYARRGCGEEAETVFRQAMQHFNENVDLTDCLNATMSAWLHNPERADALLQYAYQLATRHGAFVIPNALSHTICIESHLRQNTEEHLVHAEEHLWHMINEFERGIGPSPIVRTFYVVMEALSRSSENNFRIQKLFDKMLQLAENKAAPCAPDEQIFFVCINSWLRDKNQLLGIEYALRMLELGDTRNFRNPFLYAKIINILCRSGETDQVIRAEGILRKQGTFLSKVWPVNKVAGLYTAVITALRRLNNPVAAERAIKLLKWLSSVETGIQAGCRLYTSAILAAYILERKCPSVVYSLFQDMKHLDLDPSHKLRFDTTAFSAIFGAFAKYPCHNAAEWSIEVLFHMAELFEKGRVDLQLDQRCTASFIKSVSRYRDREIVAKIVRLLEEGNKKISQSGSFAAITQSVAHAYKGKG